MNKRLLLLIISINMYLLSPAQKIMTDSTEVYFIPEIYCNACQPKILPSNVPDTTHCFTETGLFNSFYNWESENFVSIKVFNRHGYFLADFLRINEDKFLLQIFDESSGELIGTEQLLITDSVSYKFEKDFTKTINNDTLRIKKEYNCMLTVIDGPAYFKTDTLSWEEGKFVNDQKDGLWLIYENETLVKKEYYSNGELLSRTTVNSNSAGNISSFKHFLSATKLKLAGNLNEAKKEVQIAIKMDSTQSEYFSLQGDIFYELGQNREAIESFKMAIDLNQQEGKYYYKYGLVLVELGKETKACKNFRLAATNGFEIPQEIKEKCE